MKKRALNKKLFAGLISSFCIIILFSIVLTAVGAFTIKNVRDDYAYTVSMPEIKIRLLSNAKTDFMSMRYRAANYVMNSGEPEYIHKIANVQYIAAMSSLLNNLDAYIRLNKDDIRQDAEISEENIRCAE